MRILLLVVPGVNGKVTREIVESAKDILIGTDLVMLQLEIPMATVEYTAAFCYKNHIQVILNPAPAQQLSKKLIKNVISDHPNKVIMTAGSMVLTFMRVHRLSIFLRIKWKCSIQPVQETLLTEH